jgi:acyl carrier protein
VLYKSDSAEYQMGYEMEKRFDISVPDEKIAYIDSVGDLARLIEQYLNKKK